jgi:hypothetical protein
MARRYVRDAKGRFASKGYGGQTGGRGARLKSAGKTRAGGGSRIDTGTGKPAGTISRTKRGRSSDAAERMIKRDTASNKVAPSPRQLTKNEKIARDVMADKRFRSDRQRIAEMQRRGVSPNTDFVGLASDAKRKGGGTAGGAPISYVNNKPKPAGSLTPKSKIRARMAAQAKASQAANAGNYQRRFQSDRTKAAAAQYRASGSKGQKYSTIKNPAPEGSAPFAVTGSTYQGRKNAAAGRAARDARPAQVSARGKVRKPAQNFKPAVPGKSAPDNARTRANKLRTAQNKVRMYSETTSRSAQNAISRRDAALRARPQGTPGNVIFRSKGRAANRFQQRASDLTQRVKSDLAFGKGKGIYSATGGGGGSGLRRRDTGDRQTSMFGKPAPLYKTSKVSSVRRRRR